MTRPWALRSLTVGMLSEYLKNIRVFSFVAQWHILSTSFSNWCQLSWRVEKILLLIFTLSFTICGGLKLVVKLVSHNLVFLAVGIDCDPAFIFDHLKVVRFLPLESYRLQKSTHSLSWSLLVVCTLISIGPDSCRAIWVSRRIDLHIIVLSEVGLRDKWLLLWCTTQSFVKFFDVLI